MKPVLLVFAVTLLTVSVHSVSALAAPVAVATENPQPAGNATVSATQSENPSAGSAAPCHCGNKLTEPTIAAAAADGVTSPGIIHATGPAAAATTSTGSAGNAEKAKPKRP